MKRFIVFILGLSIGISPMPASATTILDAPSNVHVTTLEYSKLRLDWTAPAHTGGSRIVDYVVKYSYHDLGHWIPYTLHDGYRSSTYVIVRNLDLNTTLRFKIYAVNASGRVSSPAYFTVHTLTPERPTVDDAATQAEMDYVYKYWNSDATHDGYKQFVGENCTNWVSQVLRARGWKMDKQWWNRLHSNYDWSWTWGSATGLYYYLTHYRTHDVKMYSDQQMKYAKIGTIISFDWDPSEPQRNHSAIVSYIENLPDGSRRIYYAGNTDHTLYRSVIWATTVRRPGGKLVYFNFKN
jgi:hypothetical protein